MENMEPKTILNKDILDIDSLYQIIGEAYNISVVTDTFCKSIQGIEEINNIAPVISILRQKLDKTYSMLIDCSKE